MVIECPLILTEKNLKIRNSVSVSLAEVVAASSIYGLCPSPFFLFFLPRAHKSELVINPGRNQNLPLFPLEQTAWLYDLSQALPLRVGGKENMVPLAILFIVSPRFFRASPLQLFFAFSSFVVGVLLAAATRYQVR